MQPKFMPWVDLLPEVGDPIRNERNKLAAKLASAEFYVRRLLPRASSHREALLGGAACLMAMPEASFAF